MKKFNRIVIPPAIREILSHWFDVFVAETQTNMKWMTEEEMAQCLGKYKQLEYRARYWTLSNHVHMIMVIEDAQEKLHSGIPHHEEQAKSVEDWYQSLGYGCEYQGRDDEGNLELRIHFP